MPLTTTLLPLVVEMKVPEPPLNPLPLTVNLVVGELVPMPTLPAAVIRMRSAALVSKIIGTLSAEYNNTLPDAWFWTS